MKLAKVVGQVVSTVKEPGLEAFKILLVEDVDPASPDSGASDKPYVAVDLVGAGQGELVIVSHGSAARVPSASGNAATDSAVVGIVDTSVINGEITFQK